MSPTLIVPVASSLYFVDGSIGFPGGKTDLVGIFNSVNAAGQFPYQLKRFVVYARLVQGLGQVPFYVEIRDAASQQLLHVSITNILHFASRDHTVEMALTMKGVSFPAPGVYLVELYCDAQWVADARLRLV